MGLERDDCKFLTHEQLEQCIRGWRDKEIPGTYRDRIFYGGRQGGKAEAILRLQFVEKELSKGPPIQNFSYTQCLETIEERVRELIKRDPGAIMLGESTYTEGDIEL